jgi:DNA replication protein DnaC
MIVLTHPTLDQLSQLGLPGMAQAFVELEAADDTAALTHTDWLGLLLDRELTYRRDKRLAARLRYARLRYARLRYARLRYARLRYARLRYARLRQQATVEDLDYRAPRSLDRALFQKLTNGDWIDAHDNLILCGPTGSAKVGLLGLRVTRPAVTTGLFPISASQSSSPSSR